MKIVNMTPHVLSIRQADGSFRNVEASGDIARREVTRIVTEIRDGTEMFESVFGALSPLPDSQEDTVFVVSSLYLAGLRAHGQDRADVYVPGEAARNEAGQVVGCHGLSR
jgi:hypothetical protein